MRQHWVAERVRDGVFGDARATPRPIIVDNPSGDAEFRSMIQAALRSGEWRPDELEAYLRTRYPLAIVRPRELAGERTQVWYVYRDGHWIRSEPDARP